eukprot:3252970-Prymnesium_polylepis.2
MDCEDTRRWTSKPVTSCVLHSSPPWPSVCAVVVVPALVLPLVQATGWVDRELSHCGSFSCRSLSSTAARISSSASVRKALWFARRRRDGRSTRRKKPEVLRLLVAAMQERDHRQCTGEAVRGMI